MGINKIIIGTTLGLLFLGTTIFMVAIRKKEKISLSASSVKIEKTWHLPEVLSEISGISFLEKDLVLAVQDEKGILFIYNLRTRKITEEIGFGDNGDYEGVAVSGSSAFVLESSGSVIKIDDFLGSPRVTRFKTSLTSKDDAEGLCMDFKNDRLLVTPKEQTLNDGKNRGIYAIPIRNMLMGDSPVFDINLENPVFEKVRKKNLKESFKPSEINIHPATGDIFLLDGVNSLLLILDPTGNPMQLYNLGKKDFPQPEGLTFGPSGNIFISNEGNPATIHQISLN